MAQAKAYDDITIHQFLKSRSTEFLMADIYLGFSINQTKRQIELRDEMYIFENEVNVIEREYTPDTWAIVFTLKGSDAVVGMSTLNVVDIVQTRKTLLTMMSGSQIQFIKKRQFFKVNSLLTEDMARRRRVCDEHSDSVYNTEVIDIGFFPLRGNQRLVSKDTVSKSEKILTTIDLF